jgi:hypothetical protein
MSAGINTDSSHGISSSSADSYNSSNSSNNGDSDGNCADIDDDVDDDMHITGSSTACITEGSATGTYYTVFIVFRITLASYICCSPSIVSRCTIAMMQ